jgi:hypothetical protein
MKIKAKAIARKINNNCNGFPAVFSFHETPGTVYLPEVMRGSFRSTPKNL